MSAQPPDVDVDQIFAAHRREFANRVQAAETMAGLVRHRPAYTELAARVETVTALSRLLLEHTDGAESFIDLEKDLDDATGALGTAMLTAARDERGDQ